MKVHKRILDKQKDRIGTTYVTNSGSNLVITKYVNSTEVYVRFIETGYETVARMSNIREGKVRDLLRPSIYGVGIVGYESPYFNGRILKEYALWKEMIRRCYDESFKTKHTSYDKCCVSDNFKHLSYFKEWCGKQVGFDNDDWHLDKDILLKGNKIYSEDTCVFVPRIINQAVVTNKLNRGKFLIGVHQDRREGRFLSCMSIGGERQILGHFNDELEAFLAYKQAKENYLKEVAIKWKDQIDHRVYEALMNYQVEITD